MGSACSQGATVATTPGRPSSTSLLVSSAASSVVPRMAVASGHHHAAPLVAISSSEQTPSVSKRSSLLQSSAKILHAAAMAPLARVARRASITGVQSGKTQKQLWFAANRPTWYLTDVTELSEDDVKLCNACLDDLSVGGSNSFTVVCSDLPTRKPLHFLYDQFWASFVICHPLPHAFAKLTLQEKSSFISALASACFRQLSDKKTAASRRAHVVATVDKWQKIHMDVPTAIFGMHALLRAVSVFLDQSFTADRARAMYKVLSCYTDECLKQLTLVTAAIDETEKEHTTLEWTAAIASNVHQIDCDHQFLFQLFNCLSRELIRARSHTTSYFAINAVINALLDYTIIHFNHEFELWKRYGYQGHLEEHQRFTDKVKEVKIAWDAFYERFEREKRRRKEEKAMLVRRVSSAGLHSQMQGPQFATTSASAHASASSSSTSTSSAAHPMSSSAPSASAPLPPMPSSAVLEAILSNHMRHAESKSPGLDPGSSPAAPLTATTNEDAYDTGEEEKGEAEHKHKHKYNSSLLDDFEALKLNDVAEFLAVWLDRHTSSADMEFTKWLRDRNIRVSLAGSPAAFSPLSAAAADAATTQGKQHRKQQSDDKSTPSKAAKISRLSKSPSSLAGFPHTDAALVL